MRREGSPFTGLSTVALKEAADHMASSRMHLVMLLVLLTAIGSIYGAIGQIKDSVGQDPFLFLRIFTTAKQPLPSFVAFLGFLLPLIGIALGFDAVNGEYNRRTMSRILSQPIFRDALLAGKFLGGLIVIGICLLTLWLLVTGMGILMVGLPPSGEEVLRGVAFLIASLVYAGVWLAVSMLFSTLFRAPATSALAALTLWLVFTLFWGMLAPLVASGISPADPYDPMTIVHQAEWAQAIGRISPAMLYQDIIQALLSPETRTLGLVFMNQLQGALMGAPLPFGQSALLIWPELSGLIAAMIVVYTISYVAFQRQEIRA
ncbi:ABC transporter permease subunit [Rhizobium halophytocola]|uniref:ABC-2 type transport system permease protein n=1 Tax=Rhizobium halophytocola TaxID=735519 RepID=A0ABS4E6G4_9HYPH|nr:ABC transporter permease [Rhizobium halophytocola]MBP1853535.1 ABC-2 type transport system permease protein [Rhizobium halophytocola]